MSQYELLTLLTSLLAIVVSLVSLVRTRKIAQEQLELERVTDERMGAVSFFKYAAWNGYSLALGKKETRMVCIPGWFLKRLHATALEELVAAGVNDPFLTKNDVLVAWWTRIALCHLPSDSDRPVTIQIGMSLRKSLSKDLLDPDKPYISNCFGFTNLLLPANTIKQNPTSKTALQLRTALNDQRTREQVEAYQAMVLDSIAPLPVFFGNGNTYQISYTNWTKAGLFQADFSAATMRERSEPLYASYIGHCQVPFKFPEGFVVVGKDVRENTWLCAYRVAGLWERVEKELEALKDLEGVK